MKTISIMVTLMACMVLAGPAHAQRKMDGMHKGAMHKGAMQGTHKGDMKDMPVMNCMMMGLSGSEKKICNAYMAKRTPAEKAVLMKRGSMCMKDSHKALMGMKPTEKLEMEHMSSGLSMAEQKTMMGMYKKLSKQEKPVFMKMVGNCCMYGMKHAK